MAHVTIDRALQQHSGTGAAFRDAILRQQLPVAAIELVQVTRLPSEITVGLLLHKKDFDPHKTFRLTSFSVL